MQIFLFSRSLHKITLVVFKLILRTQLKYNHKCHVKQPKIRIFPVLHVSAFGKNVEYGRQYIASSVSVDIWRKLNVHKRSTYVLLQVRRWNGGVLYVDTWIMQQAGISTMLLLSLRDNSFSMFAKFSKKKITVSGD